MKLDRDLIRAILLDVEARPPTQFQSTAVELDGWTEEEIGYHLMILGEAGYLEVEDVGYLGRELAFEATRLTYGGHEYVDTIRDPEVWRRTKDAAGKVGSSGLQALLEIGKAMGKQIIRERLGVDI